MLTFILSSGTETQRMDTQARVRQRGAAHYAGLSDEQLRAQLRCTHDEVVSTWAVAALITLAVVPILGILEKLAGRSLGTEFTGGTEKLASAGLSRATQQLAAHVRADASIAAILRDHPPEEALRRLRAQHPAFVARLDDVVVEWGHRGPGETELINPVFADSAARLLDVVAKLAGAAERAVTPTQPISPWVRLLAWKGAWLQRSRERARDVAIRLTHEYRLIAREIGTRLVSQGTIEHRDDVFYLIRDELLHPPMDVRYLVFRRKVERARLERERPPMEFVGHWEPRVDAVLQLCRRHRRQHRRENVARGDRRPRIRNPVRGGVEDRQPCPAYRTRGRGRRCLGTYHPGRVTYTRSRRCRPLITVVSGSWWLKPSIGGAYWVRRRSRSSSAAALTLVISARRTSSRVSLVA